MGSCISIERSPESGLKIRFSIAADAKRSVIPSPPEKNLMNGEHPVAYFEKQMDGSKPLSQIKTLDFLLRSRSSPRATSKDFGSKEEVFFDTQAWLESDCDDDFYSVNGDLASSRGSTPTHQRSFPGTPRFSKAPSINGTHTPNLRLCSAARKRRLVDLFKESRDQQQMDNYLSAINDMKIADVLSCKSSEGTPYTVHTESPTSIIKKTPNNSDEYKKERRTKAAQCCMPNLVPSLSFNERKKQANLGSPNGG